jgi:hypothetical protein
MAWILQILFIFEVLSSSIGAEMPDQSEGIFYAFKNKDVAPPCIDRNGLCSSDEELSKGSGGIPIYCLLVKFIPMLKNSSSASAQTTALIDLVKQNHKHYRTPLIHDLCNRPIPELIDRLLIEMDAKNQAYFFILENDHFDAFQNYCKQERSLV